MTGVSCGIVVEKDRRRIASRKKLNLTLALAAGRLGGILSHYALVTPVVHAQFRAVAPEEIRAQSFVLVDERGEISGAFAFDAQGRPVIRLFYQGREIFRAGGITIRQLGGTVTPDSK